MFKCIIIHHKYCMVVKVYFEITLSNLHLSMHNYYYILSALNLIFYINFILVLYIIFLLFILYLYPYIFDLFYYLIALCGACCRLHEHENKWYDISPDKISGRALFQGIIMRQTSSTIHSSGACWYAIKFFLPKQF